MAGNLWTCNSKEEREKALKELLPCLEEVLHNHDKKTCKVDCCILCYGEEKDENVCFICIYWTNSVYLLRK